MKYILVVFDGMADDPARVPGGRTPIMLARADNLKEMAQKGIVGMVRTTPEGMTPGSDVTNMAILGYPPQRYYKGRGAIEAAALGIPLSVTDTAFRANLVSVKDGLMVDSAADHISNAEAAALIEALNQSLASERLRFYPGVSYRNIMVLKNGSLDVDLYAPYKFIGEPLSAHLPKGDNAELLISLMDRSAEILEDHPVNRKRLAEGRLPANRVWFWAAGMKADFDSFGQRFGKSGTVIAGVDLIKGLGRLTGLEVPDVEGATGYIDTSYENKAAEAEAALERHDFVWVHVEAPDEAGHEKKLPEKVRAIESIDGAIVSRLRKKLADMGEPYRMLLMPDHPTPVSTGSHNADPVPFVLYDSRRDTHNTVKYSETEAPASGIRCESASELMDILLENKAL